MIITVTTQEGTPDIDVESLPDDKIAQVVAQMFGAQPDGKPHQWKVNEGAKPVVQENEIGLDPAYRDYKPEEPSQGRINQKVGAAGEEQVKQALGRIGVLMVEKIGTPVKLHNPGFMASKDVFRVFWGEKVSGDHRGVGPYGLSILAETKTMLDRNLRWSDLRPHQPERLTYHSDLGGISLLVWVHHTGTYIMNWPVDDFGPDQSISPEKAESLSIEKLDYADPLVVDGELVGPAFGKDESLPTKPAAKKPAKSKKKKETTTKKKG